MKIGYGRNLGVVSVLKVEFHAIVDELWLAWEQGVRQLVIEGDNKATVDLILKDERGGST